MTTKKTCPQCGEPFKTRQPQAIYCSRPCKTAAANLEAARGKQLYRLAYGWRQGSGAKFSDLSWLVDQFIREDKAAGRPAPVTSSLKPSTTHSYYTNLARRKQREEEDAIQQA